MYLYKKNSSSPTSSSIIKNVFCLHWILLTNIVDWAPQVTNAFSPLATRTVSYTHEQHVMKNPLPSASQLFGSSSSLSMTKNYKPIFDFMNPSPNITSTSAINKFERIDDAIMGGISSSTLRFVPNANFASWSGVLREFGGGFCGMRTLPFVEPLPATMDVQVSTDDNDDGAVLTKNRNANGLFISCRLASDNEPERRIWKMTIRTDTSRGETVYQAPFQFPKSKASQEQEWNTINVPFDSFQQVRGPRIVQNGEKLDLTNGMYQVGMTMSKFQMGANTTEIDNVRAGFFELQIQQIGLYCDNDNCSDMNSTMKDTPVALASTATDEVVKTLTKSEMMKKKPFVLKMLVAMSKIFFSEQANRRKSAMNILREKRNMTRLEAIKFGLKYRSKSIGLFNSLAKTSAILGIDSLRTVLKNILKIVLVYPLQFIRKSMKKIKKK